MTVLWYRISIRNIKTLRSILQRIALKVLWQRKPAAAPPVRGAGEVNDDNGGYEDEEESNYDDMDDKDKENGEDFQNLPSRARYFATHLGKRMYSVK